MSTFNENDHQTEGGGRLQRRTVVQGAAWTIPVVAVAAATPAAAASVQPTLEFVNGPYSADACSVVGDIVVRATTDGTTPSAGAPITVTLPDGLTWSDGSTGSRGFTAGPDGQVTLTGVKATDSRGGTFPITATSGQQTASSSVTVTPGPANRLVAGSASGLVTSETTPGGLEITDLDVYRRDDAPSGNPYYLVTLSDGSLWTFEQNVGWTQRPVSNVDHVAAYSRPAPGYLEAYASGSTLSSSSGIEQTTPNGLPITSLDVNRRDDWDGGNGYYLVTTSDGSLFVYEEKVGWSQRPNTDIDHVDSYEGAGDAYLEGYASGSKLYSSSSIQETTPNGLPITDLDVSRRDDFGGGNGLYLVTTSDGSMFVFEENVGWSERAGSDSGRTQVAAYRRPGDAYLEAYAERSACA